jgi:glycosyltransferase involved in cell wall biosynthesis
VAEVSVIVPTRNSGATLEACLQSVRAQSESTLELIVVDNFSTDETPRIAGRYADVFRQAGPERSRQRNLGAAIAGGNWLLFVDSDMLLEQSILAECLGETKRGFRALIIPEVSKGDGFWAGCKALERSCYVGDDSIEAARFIEHALFKQLGGFDEELVGEEDWDLTQRIRSRNEPIGRTRTPLLHDEGHLRLWETMRTKFYYGRTMWRYIQKHPNAARSQLRLFRPAFARHVNDLRAHPVQAAGMLMMKTCEVAAGAAGTASGWWADHRR